MRYIKIPLFSILSIFIYSVCLLTVSFVFFSKFINSKNVQTYISNKLNSKYNLSFAIDHIETNLYYTSLKLKFNSISVLYNKKFFIKIKNLKFDLVPFKVKKLYASNIYINLYTKFKKNKRKNFNLEKLILFLNFIENIKLKNAVIKLNNFKIGLDLNYIKLKKFINIKFKIRKNLINFFVYLKKTPIILFSSTNFKILGQNIYKKTFFIKKGLFKSIKGIGTFSKDFKNVYISLYISTSYGNLIKQNRNIQIKDSKFYISYIKRKKNHYFFSSIITQTPKFKGLAFLTFQPNSAFFKGKINYLSYKDINKLWLFLNRKSYTTVFNVFKSGNIKNILLSYQGEKKDIKHFLKNLKISFYLEKSTIEIPKLKNIFIQNLKGKFIYYKHNLNILNASGKTLSYTLNSIHGNINFLKPHEIKLKSKIICKLNKSISVLLENFPKNILNIYYKNILKLEGDCKGSFYFYKKAKILKLSLYIEKFQLNVLSNKFTNYIKLKGSKLKFDLKKNLHIKNFSIYYKNSKFKYISLKIDFNKKNYFISFNKGILNLKDFFISKKFLPRPISKLSGKVLINPSFLKGNLKVFKPIKINLNIDLKNIKLKYKDIPENIIIKSGSLFIDNSNIIVKKSQISVLNSYFICDGKIKNFSQKKIKYSFAVKGNLSESAIKFIYKKYRIPQSFLINPCRLDLYFNNNNSKLNIRGDLIFNNDLVLLLTIDKSKLSLQIEKKIYKNDVINLAYMEISNLKNIFKVYFDGFLYNYILISIFKNNIFMFEYLKGNFTAFININKDFYLKEFHGNLFIKNFNINLIFKNSIFVDKIELSSYNNLLILNGFITINGTTDIEIKSLIYDFNTKRIVGKVLSNTIDYKDLNLLFKKNKKKNSSNIFSSINIEAFVKEFKFKKYIFNRCNFAINLNKDNFLIKLKKLKFCSLPIKGEINLKRKKLIFSLKGKNIDFKNFLICYAKKDFIVGQMDINLSINTSFKNKDFIKSTAGKFDIKLKKGRIFKFNILMKILAILNSLDIFLGEDSDLIKKGMGYDSIIIKGTIKNSKLSIEKGIVNGKSVEIFFNGECNLYNCKMNFLVFVCPLKTIDRILKHIPLLNKITGGNILSIPFQVVGTYKKPIVIPISPKAISSQILQLFKRTIKAPFTIFQPFKQ